MNYVTYEKDLEPAPTVFKNVVQFKHRWANKMWAREIFQMKKLKQEAKRV
jgi:hypothetical protein